MSAAAVSCASVPRARLGGKVANTSTPHGMKLALRCVATSPLKIST